MSSFSLLHNMSFRVNCKVGGLLQSFSNSQTAGFKFQTQCPISAIIKYAISKEKFFCIKYPTMHISPAFINHEYGSGVCNLFCIAHSILGFTIFFDKYGMLKRNPEVG